MSARVEELFSWLEPDYVSVFKARVERLNWIMAKRGRAESMLVYYRDHVADFISDWGVTLDTRARAKGMPAYIPFILQPKQREAVDWILDLWRAGEDGLAEKSRDCGFSWVAMTLSASLCILNRDIHIGFGSATEDKVDRTGDSGTLFYKGRMFVDNLPAVFRPEYWSAHMRMVYPKTSSSMVGGAGENAFRSGRFAMGFLDEAAYLANPLAVDSAVSAATPCRIDISSISIDGMANHFAQKRHSGRVKVFTFHWRDDKRKTPEWAAKEQAKLDPIVWAADYELDYMSAAEGVIIPQLWVQSAIDAHVKLGIKPTGIRQGGLDIADRGVDVNAFSARHGIVLVHCETWSGKNSDLFATTERAFMLCDELQLTGFDYDSEGMGAGVRGDADRIKARRKAEHLLPRKVGEFRASAGVENPTHKVPDTDRTNQDFFQNLRAQRVWRLRQRFKEVHRVITTGATDYNVDDLISLSSEITELQKLCIELSQPVWKLSTTGKVMVDKVPDGAQSPNRFDSVVICCNTRSVMRISDSVFEAQEF